jgi:hypothetical protein
MPLLRAKQVIQSDPADDRLTEKEKVIEWVTILFAAATTFGFFLKILFF